MRNNKQELLSLEHTIGLLLSMVTDRNGNGYDISSQNYFRDLAVQIGKDLAPARKQSVFEARSKLSWRAFELLLERANVEEQGLPRRLIFKGHVTRASLPALPALKFGGARENANTASADQRLHGETQPNYPGGVLLDSLQEEDFPFARRDAGGPRRIHANLQFRAHESGIELQGENSVGNICRGSRTLRKIFAVEKNIFQLKN